MRSIRFHALAAALALAACKSEPPAAADKPAPPPAPAPAPAEPDYIKVLGSHADRKPTDPVEISIPGFRVVAARFDPANLEGGSAEIELDLGSLESNSDRRDGHLRSPDYLDVAKFPKATVKISAVKKISAGRYSASAEVSAHGVTVAWPVAFEVVATTADGVRVRAEHTFSRADLKIGQPAAAGDSTADQVTLKLLLTLKPTA